MRFLICIKGRRRENIKNGRIKLSSLGYDETPRNERNARGIKVDEVMMFERKKEE